LSTLLISYTGTFIVYALSIIDTLPDRRFQDFYVFIFGRNALHNMLIYDPGNGDHREPILHTDILVPVLEVFGSLINSWPSDLIRFSL
jgi:hypothetical protein